MNWKLKDINRLASEGRIKGFVATPKPANNIPAKKPAALAWLDLNLPYWCNERALQLEMEFRFCQDRKWRFDYAIPALKIAVEYEGGIFMERSGHNTAAHYTKDTEKYNRATVMGWRVIRVTAMNYTTALKQLNEMIKEA